MSELLFETDWLGSRPVFYNELTRAASYDINDVIVAAEVEIDPDGLRAYLAAGYSIFGRTPVRHVRYVPPSTRLWRDDDGMLRLEAVPLDLNASVEAARTEAEVIDLLRERVRKTESSTDDRIIIPTSGGYDSRLLNLMVANVSRVRSYTFGPTARQWDSTEVARARALSGLLGTRWERIHLEPFHTHLDEWDRAFGPAVHAHGMYQMEFYRQIRAREPDGGIVLSGHGGDWCEWLWDEAVEPLRGPNDLQRLILSHGAHADADAALLGRGAPLAEQYFETHREELRTFVGRTVEGIRFRVMLTHYLVKVPRLYGFAVDEPFLDFDVASAMLSLPDERRRDRRWVDEYLASRGALFKDVQANDVYWLYWPVMRSQPLEPLDVDLLSEIVQGDYVRWANRTVRWRGLWWEGYERMSRHRPFRRAAKYLSERGIKQQRLPAYHAYMTLRPLERLLRRRDAARLGHHPSDRREPR